MSLQAYDVWEAAADLPDPDWPDVPFEKAANVIELEICSVTGKNPTPYCPVKTEIYNKKYVPEGICPIHTGAIDKKKGKIDF